MFQNVTRLEDVARRKDRRGWVVFWGGDIGVSQTMC